MALIFVSRLIFKKYLPFSDLKYTINFLIKIKEGEIMNWWQEEFKAIDLGDKRLNTRATNLLKSLGRSPGESIPSSCGGWEETKSAYRFFENQNVTVENILVPHQKATIERIKKHQVVLFIQDTSTLNYTSQKQRKDIGPINRDNTKGIFIHPTLAVTPERLCLGIVDHYQWSRKELAHKDSKERSRLNHLRKPEDKESYRWVKSYQKASEYARQLKDTLVVSVGDREADLYELYHEAQQEVAEGSAHWLIRSSYDRWVVDEKNKQKKLIATVKKSGELGAISFELPASNGQPKRLVEQVLYAKRVKLKPSSRKQKAGYAPVDVNIIIATELNPPHGKKPLEWILCTSIFVDNFEKASELIQWYLCRWQIEIYFKILKSGCKIEKLALTEKKRFDACLALYMIIAWRILYITMLGRENPDVPCDCVFDVKEWQTVYIVFYKKKPPKKPPKLNDMVKMIASLGGFLNRKNDGEPGPQTMWIGMRNMYEHVRARLAFEDAFGQTYG